MVIGLLGALLGILGGLLLGLNLGDLPAGSGGWGQLAGPNTFLLGTAIAVLLSGIGSWIPAILAARQDPAVVLQKE